MDTVWRQASAWLQANLNALGVWCQAQRKNKAWLVAGGHLTDAPLETVYSGVVSLHSLCLVIFVAKLNKLEPWGADIGNAYLEAKIKEKVFIIGDAGFGNLEGHTLIIYKALCGLKSSGKY